MQLQQQLEDGQAIRSPINRFTLGHYQSYQDDDLDDKEPSNKVSSISPKRQQKYQVRTPGTVSNKKTSKRDLDELNFQVQLNSLKEASPILKPQYSQNDEHNYQTRVKQNVTHNQEGQVLNRTISSKYEEEQHSSKSSQIYKSPSHAQKRVKESKIEQVQQLYQGQSTANKNLSSHKKPSLRQSFTSGQSYYQSLSQQQQSSNVRKSLNNGNSQFHQGTSNNKSKASSAAKSSNLNLERYREVFSSPETEEGGFSTLVHSQLNQHRFDSIASSANKIKSASKVLVGSTTQVADPNSSLKKRSSSKNNTSSGMGQPRNSHVRSFSTRQDNFVAQSMNQQDSEADNTRKSTAKGYQSLKRAVDEIYIHSSSTTPQKRQSNIGASAIKSKNPFGQQSSSKKAPQFLGSQSADSPYDSIEIQPKDIYQLHIGSSAKQQKVETSGGFKRTKYLNKIEQRVTQKPFNKNQSTNRLASKNLSVQQMNQTLGSSHSLRNIDNNGQVTTATNSQFKSNIQGQTVIGIGQGHQQMSTQQRSMKPQLNFDRNAKGPSAVQNQGIRPKPGYQKKKSTAKLSSVNQSNIHIGSQLQQSQFIEEGDSLMMQDISFFNQVSTNNLTTTHIQHQNEIGEKSLSGSKSTKNIQSTSFIQSNAAANGRVQRLFKKQVAHQSNYQSLEKQTLQRSLSKSVSEQTLSLQNNLRACSPPTEKIISYLNSNRDDRGDQKFVGQNSLSNYQNFSLKAVSNQIPQSSLFSYQKQLHNYQKVQVDLNLDRSYDNHQPVNTQSMIQQQTPSSSSASSNANEPTPKESKTSVVHIFNAIDQEAIEEEFLSKSKSMGIPNAHHSNTQSKVAESNQATQKGSVKPVIYDEKNDQYFIEDSQPSTSKHTSKNITSMVLDYQKSYQENIQKSLVNEQLEQLKIQSQSSQPIAILSQYSPDLNLQQLDTQRYRDSNYDLNDRVEEQSENVIDDESTNKAADSPFSVLDQQTADFRKRANSAGLLSLYSTPYHNQYGQRGFGNQSGQIALRDGQGQVSNREGNASGIGGFISNENGPSQFDAITVQRNIPLEEILKFLIVEEEHLNNLCQMVQQGQLIEMQSQLPASFSLQYLDLIQSVDCKKERPKFFAQQLQVTIVLTNALIEIFSPALIQKFSLKLRTIYTNIHQNFVLLIDQILNCCNINPKDSLNYILLRKMIVKKLKNKLKSKRITLLRQNNEVNLLNVKKICRHMATYGSMTQVQGTGDIEMNPFHQEFKLLGNEMLEILRTFDKITIKAILGKIALKDEIANQKKQQALQQVPSYGAVAGSPQRRKVSQKHQSPKFSPRIGGYHNFSPAQSSKSNRSNRNSITSNSSKDNKQQPKRPKPQFESLRKSSDINHQVSSKQSPSTKVSQKLDHKQTQDKTLLTQQSSLQEKAKNDTRFKSRTEYTEANQSLKSESLTNQQMFSSESVVQTSSHNDCSNSTPTVHSTNQTQSNGLFFLPESIAFILSNSVQTSGNGITNINNNINIYNSALPAQVQSLQKQGGADIDLRKLKEEARNAQVMGKINIKTGKIEMVPHSSSQQQRSLNSQQIDDTSSQVGAADQRKRTAYNQNIHYTSKRQGVSSPKKGSNLNKTSLTNQSVTSQGMTHAASKSSLHQAKPKKGLSRQNLSQQASRIDKDSQIGDDEEFMKLNIDQVDLARENSGTSNIKSLAQSPSKKGISNRVQSRQPITNQGNFNKALSSQGSKQVAQRPKSRQNVGQTASIRSQQIQKRSSNNNDLTASKNEGNAIKSDQNSVASTPIKNHNNEPSEYITNVSMATDKSYKPILSGAKKHQPTLSSNAKTHLHTKSPTAPKESKPRIPSKNIQVISPDTRTGGQQLTHNLPGKSFIAKAVSQQKQIKANLGSEKANEKISEFKIGNIVEADFQTEIHQVNYSAEMRDRNYSSDANLIFKSTSNDIPNFIATQPFDRGYVPTPDAYPDSARNLVPTALNFNNLGDTQSFDDRNRLEGTRLNDLLESTQNLQEECQSLMSRDRDSVALDHQNLLEDYGDETNALHDGMRGNRYVAEDEDDNESLNMMGASKYPEAVSPSVRNQQCTQEAIKGSGMSYNKQYTESTAEKQVRRREEEEYQKNEQEELDLFILNETRLNLLLDKMNQDIQIQQIQRQDSAQVTGGRETQIPNLESQRLATEGNQSKQISIQSTPKQRKGEELRQQSGAQTPREMIRKSSPFELSPNAEESPSGKSKLMQQQFGNLLEQHMDSLDLKKEMEKLKQLDEEQKRLKRISLKINTRGGESYAHSQNQSVASSGGQLTNQSIIESPGKKILIGEFDETNQEDEGFYFNIGDELLLSAESKKHVIFSHQSNAIEVLDFQDYITQKTGMQDPFPDHIDPDEESKAAAERQVKDFKLSDEMEALRKDQEENERLRTQVKIPYLPPLEKNEYIRTYTLVLDLDETLIHFECDEEEQDEEEQGYYLIRPGAIKFLNELSKYYELVIFTAAMPDYADWILDNVDRHKIIKHRLYRQHTTPHEDYAIKDLRNLGRALERTIIIDNLAENFSHTTPANGIWVESWYDDMDDTVMELLIPFLKDIVMSRCQDVRRILTPHNKDNIIYRCLEESKELPSVNELLQITSDLESQIVKQISHRGD